MRSSPLRKKRERLLKTSARGARRLRIRITILAALNLPYATWPDFLANPALTKALLSRLRERCHTITIDGPCIRPQTG
jgi:DNA replication protein DnaC